MKKDIAHFKVGDEVICVDDSKGRYCPFKEEIPIKGERYHIREIEKHPSGGWGVRLEEIINRPYNYYQGYSEVWFNADRFRKVHKTKTSSEVAQEILEKFPLHEGPEVDVPVKEIVNN